MQQLPLNIMHIDDDEYLRAIVKLTLNTLPQFQVNAFDGAKTALSALQQIRQPCALPDIILLDLIMPGMDGLAMLRALQSGASTRDIPVILMTAKASEAHIRHYTQAGATAVIKKPFDPISLPQQLTQIWQNHLATQHTET